MLELVGWVGALAFAISAAPQAWLCWKRGKATGISVWFLILWGVGEWFSLVYGLATLPWESPILWNYVVNGFFWVVIVRYKVRPRRRRRV